MGMGNSFLRTRNIFNPYQMEQQPPLGNMPQSPELPGMGQIQPGSVYAAPQIGSVQPPIQQQPPMQPQMSPQDEINQLMQSLYSPETGMSDRLRGMIDNMPQRPQNLSLARKIGSVMVGAGLGPEAQEKATYAPYYRELEDWKTKLSPTLQGAQLERYNNANERQLAYQTASATTAARRAGVAEEGEKRRLAKSQADIERDKQKLKLAKFKEEHPDWEQKQGDNGNIWLVPPRPGLGDPVDTGLTSADYTDMEKAEQRMEEIEAGIAGRVKVKGTPDARASNPNDPRNLENRDLYDNEGNVVGTAVFNKITKTFEVYPTGTPIPSESLGPTGSPRTKGGASPTADAKSLENRIQTYLLEYPDDQKWIKQDPATGQFRVQPPGSTFGYATGPDKETYDRIANALKGIKPKAKPPAALGGGKSGTTPGGANWSRDN